MTINPVDLLSLLPGPQPIPVLCLRAVIPLRSPNAYLSGSNLPSRSLAYGTNTTALTNFFIILVIFPILWVFTSSNSGLIVVFMFASTLGSSLAWARFTFFQFFFNIEIVIT